jgi:trehalose/maltose hydrolase-like predicted phosphorylase
MAPRPISPPPITDYRPEYRAAYLSNGLLGLRVGRIPFLVGLCMVDGLVERDPVEDGEGFARGPYPLWGDVVVDGHALTSRPDRARLLEQSYDFATGELHTRFVFQPQSAGVTIEDVAFCSRTLPTLALHEVRVEVDQECDLVLSGGINHIGISGEWVSRRTQTPGTDVAVVDGLMEWRTSGGLSTCGAAYVTSLHGARGAHRLVDDIDQRAPLRTSYAFRAHPGHSYVLHQVTSLISSRLHTEPDRMSARMAYLGATHGFDRIRRDNREVWAELWKGRPILHGAPERWQAIADASFYYLHSSAHRSSIFGTAMFGLAYWPDYHYYRGHVMWDIEGFTLPVFILTDPAIARSLLDYRLARLGAARRNAAMNGYQGVQFPWAASAVHGEEVIRLSKARVIFEQHVNMAVAFAFARYCHATGDPEYLRERAWEVLSGVAEWITSRGFETERGFEIHECLGIAEQELPVDNHSYVNMAAAVVLREAAAAARTLGIGVAGSWERLADRMYIPVDEATNVILNHEGYVYREGDVAASTPEALAGLFPFTYDPGTAREQATLRFYLDRVGPYVGYPMLSAPLGAWAARLGDRDLSARMFEQGYAEFVEAPFLVANEFSQRFPHEVRAGPLMANVGGFLTSLVYGLTGLVLGPGQPDSWARRPAVMPALWDAVEIERVWARGRPMRLVARHGSLARLEPHEVAGRPTAAPRASP